MTDYDLAAILNTANSIFALLCPFFLYSKRPQHKFNFISLTSKQALTSFVSKKHALHTFSWMKYSNIMQLLSAVPLTEFVCTIYTTWTLQKIYSISDIMLDFLCYLYIKLTPFPLVVGLQKHERHFHRVYLYRL